MNMELKYKKIGSQKPKYLCIIMHGYGSNCDDMKGLAYHFTHSNQKIAEEVLFICPDAPHRWEGSEGYENAHQWFSLASRDDKYISDGLNSAMDILITNIQKWEAEFDITQENVILSGFSQGAMLSMHTAVCQNVKRRGVLSFSGTFLARDELDLYTHKTKFCLIHGSEDEILPASMSQIAHKLFKNHDLNSSLHIIEEMPHSINEECLNIAEKFIQELLEE